MQGRFFFIHIFFSFLWYSDSINSLLSMLQKSKNLYQNQLLNSLDPELGVITRIFQIFGIFPSFLDIHFQIVISTYYTHM